jgi:predicted RNA-binding Zn-ribbon protein involved in translation (DUF1610 family)
VPWCVQCDRYLSPNTVRPDGTCPSCGREVDTSRIDADRLVSEEGDEHYRAPWHFWLMIAAAVIYLGWRLVQGIWWLIGHVS